MISRNRRPGSGNYNCFDALENRPDFSRRRQAKSSICVHDGEPNTKKPVSERAAGFSRSGQHIINQGKIPCPVALPAEKNSVIDREIPEDGPSQAPGRRRPLAYSVKKLHFFPAGRIIFDRKTSKN